MRGCRRPPNLGTHWPVKNPSLDWLIAGGESGPGARAMKREWALTIRDRCIEAGVPFFFKQWGGVRRKEAGRLLEGRAWDEMPNQQVSLSGSDRSNAAMRMHISLSAKAATIRS